MIDVAYPRVLTRRITPQFSTGRALLRRCQLAPGDKSILPPGAFLWAARPLGDIKIGSSPFAFSACKQRGGHHQSRPRRFAEIRWQASHESNRPVPCAKERVLAKYPCRRQQRGIRPPLSGRETPRSLPAGRMNPTFRAVTRHRQNSLSHLYCREKAVAGHDR